MTTGATDNKLLALIAREELSALEPHLELVSLDLGEPLIKPNAPIEYVYFPITCLASLVTVLDDGSSVEAGSVGREGMVGVPVILNADTTPMQTLIQVGGVAFRMKAAVMRDVLAKSRTLQTVLNRYVATLFVVASQSAACNRRHQVSERLARWLLMSSDGVGSDEVAITHEFLATMLGVRRSGVTEAAGRLQEEGLIQYRRGGVRIVDRHGLERASCECYRIVRDEYERVLGEY